MNHTPRCRFCNADESFQSIKGEFVFGGREDQHFWRCSKCQIIYLYPIINEEEEKLFYNKEFEKYMAKRAGKDMDWTGPEKHFQSNQREVKRRMVFLEKIIKPGMKVLELGCSSGFMLDALKSKGLDVYGIDPSNGFIDFVRAKGIKVYDGLKALKKECDIKFDLIIHYYVLEHIREPIQFLNEYMHLLEEGGKMLFEIPCASEPLIELYKIPAFDKFYWSVAHHWYFNKTSLSNFLDKFGFKYEIYPEQRYDISNHMTWMLDGKPGGLGRYSNIFGEELDRLYKEKLKENWLCDTIVCIMESNKKK